MGKSSFPDGQKIGPGWTRTRSRMDNCSFPDEQDLVPGWATEFVPDGQEFDHSRINKSLSRMKKSSLPEEQELIPGWKRVNSRMNKS